MEKLINDGPRRRPVPAGSFSGEKPRQRVANVKIHKNREHRHSAEAKAAVMEKMTLGPGVTREETPSTLGGGGGGVARELIEEGSNAAAQLIRAEKAWATAILTLCCSPSYLVDPA